MSENPFEEGSIGVTLKQGKGFEAPWITIKASSAAEAKRHLEEITGLSGEGISLAAATYNAAQHFQKVADMGTVLDATVIPDEAPAAAPKAESKPKAEPAKEPEPAAEVDHFAAIEKLDAKADLTAYYLKNKDAFDADSDLMDKLQERFKKA